MTLFWVILLLVAGMVLVLSEFIVPGGICGILGVVLVVASCVVGVAAYPDFTLWIILGEIVGVTAGILAGIFLLSRTRAGKAIILESTQQAVEGWVAWESDKSLVGKVGRVYTQLRPAGTILVDGKRLDAVTSGELIEKDAAIRVIEVHGNRIVVERAEDAASEE